MVNTRGVRVKWLRTNNHDTTWRARKGGDRCDDVMSEIQDGVISLKLATKLSRAVLARLRPLVPLPKLARVQSSAAHLCLIVYPLLRLLLFLTTKYVLSHWRWCMKMKGIEQWKKSRAKIRDLESIINVNKSENNL